MSDNFEGWYFKHQKDAETLAIVAGRAKGEAFLQVITNQQSYPLPYPLAAYRKGKLLEVGESCFAANGIRLSIQRPELQLSGQLRYSNMTPIDGDIMGPFRLLPMQCRHQVVSMNHRLSGRLILNGEVLDFTGGKGYLEGDSGRSFPKSYTWVHCNAFASDCSIMASVAHIPFAGLWFWGCICVVWLEGKEYRIATYRGAKIRYRGATGLLLEQKDLSLRVRFLQPNAGHSLKAPNRGQMNRTIHEVPAAPAFFEFKQGSHTLFQEESQFASYEHVPE